MKILFIAYAFPPRGGGAVSRVHGFIKHLPEFGVKPYVLTVKHDHHQQRPIDHVLLDQYDPIVEIYRSGVLFENLMDKDSADWQAQALPEFRFFQPVVEKGSYLPLSILMGRKIIQTHQVDAIIATGPPFGAHVVGAVLARMFNIPLLLDYRDLWTINASNRNKLFKRVVSWLPERFSIWTANKLIFTNQNARDKQKYHFDLPDEKSVVIENGFDEALINQALKNKTEGKDEAYRLRYIGNLNRVRTPEYFFLGLKKFIDQHPEVPLKVSFVGYVHPDFIDLAKSVGVHPVIEYVGAVSKVEALTLMVNSEALLLLQRQSGGGETAIPGKLYEYLAAGLPVLSIDEGGGATTAFLQQLGLPTVTEYENPDAILKSLENLLLNYETQCENFKLVQTEMNKYTRNYKTEQLVQTVNEVLEVS